MDLQKFISSRLDKFRNDVANTIVGGANTVLNTKFIPGQKQTVSQVLSKPEKLFLPSALANMPKSNPISAVGRPVGQANRGFLDAQSVGFLKTPGQKPTNLTENLAYGAGYIGGMINPINPVNQLLGVTGSLAERGASALGSRLAPTAVQRTSPQLLKAAGVIGKNVAGEAAQAATLVGLAKATGNKDSFSDELKAGLLMRGAFGGAGRFTGKMFGNIDLPRQQDAYELDRTVEVLRNKAKYDKQTVDEALNILDRLSDKNLSKKVIDSLKGTPNAKISQRIKLLQKVFANVDPLSKAKQYDIPGMGIVGKNDAQLPQTPSVRAQNALQGQQAVEVANSQDPYFNTNKLKVSSEAKTSVNKTIEEVKPQIEQVVGKKLSNKEIIETANRSANVLRKVTDRNQTAVWETSLLKARQKLAAAAQSGKVDQEYIDTLLTVKSQATDIGRKLQSFSIGADPKTVTSQQAIMEAVLKIEKNTDEVLKAAKGVDFNDLRQATEFYRKFVQPKKSEWLDTLRYNSMLSSPNTHINNAFSNAVSSAVVAPIEKTVTGTLDFLRARITGGKQKAYVGEAGEYVKGYYSKLGDAAHSFANVMRNETVSGNPDTRNIPLATSGVKGKVYNTLSYPMKLLEGMDQFFTTLTAGGETAALKYRANKGVNVGNIETQAADNAAYRLYRSELHDARQGHVLNAIDDVTAAIQRLRSSDNPVTANLSKFVVPFLRTPMNILKQSLEYSPAGLTTLPGAADKTEQLSKAIVGSSMALGMAMLATSGRTTWAEPTNPKKKAAFRAAGMQPYAVKIGDQWVSYSKLPPALSANLALIAAVNDAQQNKTINQSDMDAILSAMAKYGNFFADQSYIKQIGDMVSAAKGDTEAVTRYFSNYPQQLIPFRALAGWITRIVDPYQRKVDTDGSILEQQVQQLMTQIPGLSQNVSARLDNNGQPIENQNRLLNAVSPLRVTTERPEAAKEYQNLQQKTLDTKNLNIVKAGLDKNGQPTAQYNNIVVYKGDDGKTHTVNLAKNPQMPQMTGNSELDKQLMSKYRSQINTKINDITTLFTIGKISAEDANKQILALRQQFSKVAKPKKLKAAKIKLGKIKFPKVKKAKVKKLKVKKIAVKNIKVRKSA